MVLYYNGRGWMPTTHFLRDTFEDAIDYADNISRWGGGVAPE